MPPNHGGPDTAHTINWPVKLKSLYDVKSGPPSQGKEQMCQNAGMPGGAMSGGGMPDMSGETIYCANTVEELFDYTGCYKGAAREKALAEVRRYNEMCEKGIDEDFGKDPRILKVTAIKEPWGYSGIVFETAKRI